MKQKSDISNDPPRSLGEWRKLADRYFEADISDEEETALRRFLASPLAAGKEFDEAKAVMGFLSVGRKLRKRSRRFRLRKGMAAAAMAAVVLSAAGYLAGRDRDVCVAYINGEKCTDEQIVLAQMRETLCGMNAAADELSVESRLNDLFETLDEN